MATKITLLRINSQIYISSEIILNKKGSFYVNTPI